jgi:hypothetical protein
MKQLPKPARARIGGFWLLVFLVLLPAITSGADPVMPDPTPIVRAYLRAVYARDFAAAYALISSADQKVRPSEHYIRQRGAFSGFVLQAARELSDAVETEIVERRELDARIRLRVRYQIPDSGAIAPLLLNWDAYRLNALDDVQRAQILGSLQQQKRERALAMISGEDNIDMVNEGGEWRVFLNWAAGVRIPLSLETPASGALHAVLSQAEMKVQPGDVFEVGLRVRNNTSQPILARIGHLIEPRSAADYLDIVQCGFLLPVSIAPGAEQEYSGTYLLRGSLPENVRELRLTYDFKILD